MFGGFSGDAFEYVPGGVQFPGLVRGKGFRFQPRRRDVVQCADHRRV